ncbi:histidine kinase [Streptomyces scopuliridis]|uniref:sensor histidine kinase n=1 Tax=Streptomyces scopuliridis TaxID=452529 RepID=UPI002DD9BF37|nr:histidine kinase [Streptomyces scopuliridis]WSB36364.1 histidine kinase [Streptomyces scopuliridis]
MDVRRLPPERARRAWARARSGTAHAVRSVRREAAGAWPAVRRAPRRTVVAETLAVVVTAALGLVPLLLIRPERPVLAVLEALYAACLMPLRRYRPVQAVLGTGPLLVGPNVWVMAVVPLIVLSATRRIAPPRRAWRAAGIACAVCVVLTITGNLIVPGAWVEYLAGNAASAVLLVLLPALAGTLLGRRRPLVSLLRERNTYLEQARSLTAAAARMEERTRIAGEMHDLLGHRLSLISVHAGALEMAAARQAPPLAGQAELLRTTAGTAMEELRDILGLLRREEATSEPERDRGTRDDVSALVAESRLAGVGVELDWSVPDSADPSPRTRQSMHRVVREGLTNVLKHASGAPTRVEIRNRDGVIEVSVTNEAPREGRRPQPGNRSGLVGLEERIALLGGSFTAGPLPDGGFRVVALLPSRPNGMPTAAVPLPPASEPAGGRTVRTGTRPPLSTEVLTWPRVLGAGCAAALVILPTATFLIILLTTAVLR